MPPRASRPPFALFARLLLLVEHRAVDVEAHASPLVPYCAALASAPEAAREAAARTLRPAVAEIQRRQRAAAEEEGDPAILGVLGGLVSEAGAGGGGAVTRHVGDEDDPAVFAALGLP